MRLLDVVRGTHGVPQRTDRLRDRTDGLQGVNAARRTGRDGSGRVQFDVGCDVVRVSDGITGGLAMFQGELIGRVGQFAEVVDAGAGLGIGTGSHVVGNPNAADQPR